ncbi:Ccs1 protein [Candida orthopsilosis Co 90-125]|uniref:Superoxide dismutase 1 copper chaperone n=1 Tax=Candida orthopsilosis (strain 90-125) TaxID=1136231 RepID=H8WWY5_CANO9|nr:Ccs1 protein [Candida orthopsilosis Co 90-125]CCG21125.1 Ccs1 protein [Candida orthopsilosis Co 90-125]
MTASAFEIVFAVPMECKACVESITNALKPLDGVDKFDINLKSNLVITEGSLPPSEIVKAIQATGRDAIIRGTGKPDSAAVCILESFDPKDRLKPVKGLARIVQVSPQNVFVDLTVNGLPKGVYYPSIRASGNLSEGALSTGKLFYALDPINVNQPSNASTTINSLGASTTEDSEELYAGQSFLYAKLTPSQLIGRSIVLSTLQNEVTKDSLVGVIARSAGAWENDKQVCSCSGKTIWQERTDAKAHGVAV